MKHGYRKLALGLSLLTVTGLAFSQNLRDIKALVDEIKRGGW
jgi:hypothetical protein